MLDGYHVFTLTYKDVSLDRLGKLVLPQDADGRACALLTQAREYLGWEELMYLATCNRVMFIYYAPGPQDPADPDTFFDLLYPDLSPAERHTLSGQIRRLDGEQAVRHVIETAASLDSLVIGEREIIRQFRESYEQSRVWGLTGDHLRLLVRFTIESAKQIYSQTGIGEKALSVVALAFQQIPRAGIGKNSRILLVGAGQTNALMAKFLDKFGYRRVTVFNRTLEKAQAIAEYLDGRAFALSDLAGYQEGFDALIVCTGSTEPVITAELFHRLRQAEDGKKLVIDLSVPRNVSQDLATDASIQYVDVESLREEAAINLKHREKEREKAVAMIGDMTLAFRERWHERQVEKALAHLPDEVREVKEKAVYEVFSDSFRRLDPDTQQLILEMLGYMEKKCVSIPMKAVKAIALKRPVDRKKLA